MSSSRCTREAIEYRDGGEAWLGKGVQQAVHHIETHIQSALVGVEADLAVVDQTMLQLDGSENKAKLKFY